ncbi:hypothetical protein GLOIN_2v1642117 [Rhizophagus irregularis DAOM 181602=DAOM 197198]|nr:hypothetical protein GLOIN_2v1642117 [Rhizophagus irregularis DAOM 181602=DAOM 197198]
MKNKMKSLLMVKYEVQEVRVNKLADASFELEATFRAKGELKNKLEAKEAEYLECKNECDNNDEMITGLANFYLLVRYFVASLGPAHNSLIQFIALQFNG